MMNRSQNDLNLLIHIYILKSAKALNLDCSKILSFDKEVMDFFSFVLLVPEDHLNT